MENVKKLIFRPTSLDIISGYTIATIECGFIGHNALKDFNIFIAHKKCLRANAFKVQTERIPKYIYFTYIFNTM